MFRVWGSKFGQGSWAGAKRLRDPSLSDLGRLGFGARTRRIQARHMVTLVLLEIIDGALYLYPLVGII